MLLMFVLSLGCSSGSSSYLNTDVNFSFVQRVAILPFQNISQDLHGGTRMHSVFMASVLEQDALSMVSLGEILNAMSRLHLSPDAAFTPTQIVDLGRELKVDAIFTGTVEEYGLERASNARVYVVTASFSMLETETGSLIWKTQVHENGTSIWRKLFGGGSASLYDVSRSVANKALESLF
jgi:hypothetical protein